MIERKLKMTIAPELYSDYSFEGTAYVSIDSAQDINPRSYLGFSQADMGTGSDVRSNINALSNAKRALHFQIELLAKAFGLKKQTKTAGQGIANRLEFCRRCGLTAPKILEKVNRVRNLAEHEYYVPSRTEVEDFVDVVELFISATERFLKQFPTEMEWTVSGKTSSDLPDIRGIAFPPSEGVIYLLSAPVSKPPEILKVENFAEWFRSNSIQIHVTDGDPYFRWVSFLVENCY